MLAVITVTGTGTTALNDGIVSLEEAIAAANTDTSVDGSTAGSGADVIEFAAGLAGTITVSDQSVITTPMEINGPGSGLISVSGNGLVRIFNIGSGAQNIAIRDLTLTNALASNGEARGGAIFFDADTTLTLENVVISDSSSSGAGGAIAKLQGNLDISQSQFTGNSTTSANSPGGAIFSSGGNVTIDSSTISGNMTAGSLSYGGGVYAKGGNLTVTASTISGNSTTGTFADGAGIFSDTNLTTETTTIINSTLSGNTSSGRGGGLFSLDGLTVIRHSTITGNQAIGGSAGVSGGGVGSYADAATRTEVESTIISGNTGGDVDFIGGLANSFLTMNHNLIGTGNAIANFDGVGDQTNVTDPRLGALADNGGPTLTHAPAADSPAVDTGNPTFDATTLPNDQRGAPFSRVANGRIDIGSLESGDSPPSISPIADQAVAVNVATGALAFTISDAVTASTSLVVTAASDNQTLVPDANITLAGTGDNRTVTVTPAAGVTGTATISIMVADTGGAVSTETFLLTVGDPPTISDIVDQTLETGNTTPAIGFTINDTETALSTLVVAATSSNPTLLPDANIALGGVDGNRTITLMPINGRTGSATVTVSVTDEGGFTATDTFVLTVTAPPTISDIPDLAVATDTTTSALSFTIADPDSSLATLGLTASSSDQTLVPDGNIVLGGSDSNRTVTITPAAGQTGTATITVTVTDEAGSSASDTFLLTVGGVNASPSISDIPDQTAQAGRLSNEIPFTIGDAETPVETLTVVATSSDQVLISNSSIVLGGTDGNRTLAVQPIAGQTGSATITVTVTDEGGLIARDTFVVTVIPFDSLPLISDIPDQSSIVDTPIAIGFTVSDIETNAADLVVAGTSSNQSLVPNNNIVFGGTDENRTMTITPATGQAGTATITVTVTDDGGQVVTDTFLLTVEPANASPTITPIEDLQLLINTSTPSIGFTIGDAETLPSDLVVTATSSDQSVIRDANINLGGSGQDRTITVTPATDQVGEVTITISVTDERGAVGVEAFVITVAAPNSPPTIGGIANQSVMENNSTPPIGFTIGDVETLAGDLVVSAVSSSQTLVPNGNIVFGGSGADRTVVITPLPDQIGSSTIVISVTDSAGATATESFVLTVDAANAPPTITNIINQSVKGNLSTSAIPFTASDAETLPASLVIEAKSSNQTLVPDANIVLGGSGVDRTIMITPTANLLGTATITVSVTDEGGLTATDTFILSVTEANTPPRISKTDDQSIPRNSATREIEFTVNDTETIDRFLLVTATSSNPDLVPNDSIVLGGSDSDRTIKVTPAANQSGSTTITMVVTDEGGLTATDSFFLTVLANNARPTISDIAQQTTEVGTPTAAIPISVSDPETLASSLVVTGTSSDQTLVPDENIEVAGSGADRTVTITPVAGQTGSTTISVTVTDADGGTDTSTFTLAVIPANTAPTITSIDDQSIIENTSTAAIGFTIGDLETPPASLLVTTTSSNPALVPQGNMVVSGTGASKTITVTPATDQTGNATINVVVTDSAGLSTSESFILSVNEPVPTTTVSLQTSAQTRLEDAGELKATLQLSSPSDSPVSVPFTLTGSAANGSDFMITQSPVVIPAGITSLDILVNLIDDNADEPDETITIELGTPVGALLDGDNSVHTVTIVDNDEPVVVVPPTVNVSQTTAVVDESQGLVTVTVELSAVSDSPIDVPFTVAGTATGSGADFTIGSSPLTIPAGLLSANLTLAITEDNATELDETIVISLGIPTGANLGQSTVQTITIRDNDSPVSSQPIVSLVTTPLEVSEGVGSFDVTAVLSEASDTDVTAPYSVSGTASNGSDYTVTISPITIAAGQTSAGITINVNDDSAVESDETVVVTLGTPTGATLGTTTVHTVTILNNDEPVVTTPQVSFDRGSQTAMEDVGLLTVNVMLSEASTSTVVVPFSVSGTADDGSDFTVTSSPLTFAPGVTSATVSINVINDTLDEGNESISLQLGNPTGATLGATSRHDVTIVDDDGAQPSDGKIITPSLVARPHFLASEDVPTAILFRALADTVLTVGQIGVASVAEMVTLLDEALTPQGGKTSTGLFQADLSAGELYALIFQPRDDGSIFLIQSSAGPGALGGASPTNLLRPTDVNGDGDSSALDALMIINRINQQISLEGEDVDSHPQPVRYYDVNGDGRISAADALGVINEMAEQNGPGNGEQVIAPEVRPGSSASSSEEGQRPDFETVEPIGAARAAAAESVALEWTQRPIVVVDFETAEAATSNVDELLSDSSFFDEL